MYGAGAYTTALLISKLQIPFFIAFLAGPVGAALISAAVGWFCVRRTAVYFSMLTLAFSQLMYTICLYVVYLHRWRRRHRRHQYPRVAQPAVPYYYFTLGVLLICLFTMWRIVNSPLGKTLQALRENPDRTRFIGINVKMYQYAAFVIGNFFLGAAGSLYCGFNQSVFADFLFWTKTFEIIIVYLLGGIYTFLGPSIGAIIYILSSKIITSWTEYWPLTLGSSRRDNALFTSRCG